jgi:hypothetical protein
MGAGNVAMAFQLYAGKVPATSMQVLLYMAVVSKDADPNPWFSKGREALAQVALGRPAPFDRADARAVERAVEPLLAVGAIETDRRAAVRRDGSSTARYRLNLDADGPRKTWSPKKRHAPRKTSGVEGDEDPRRPTESAPHAPRKTSSRPTENVLTPHEIRGAEEKEDLSRSEVEEEMADLQTASHPPRVAAPSDDATVVSIFRRTNQAQATLDAASARVAARKAAHQATLTDDTEVS